MVAICDVKTSSKRLSEGRKMDVKLFAGELGNRCSNNICSDCKLCQQVLEMTPKSQSCPHLHQTKQALNYDRNDPALFLATFFVSSW